MSTVEAWRAKCDPAILPAIDALRAIAKEAGPDLAETIKWNGPNFARDGQDRITIGRERSGGARVVLHRGAAKSSDGFSFSDPDGLAQWPSSDRGVLSFADAAAVQDRRPALTSLFARWLDATT